MPFPDSALAVGHGPVGADNGKPKAYVPLRGLSRLQPLRSLQLLVGQLLVGQLLVGQLLVGQLLVGQLLVGS